MIDFFFKQKTAYEIYQCDWSSDVCSSDLFKSGNLPEDEKFRCLKEIQDETDEYIKEIDDLLKAKEEELLHI